MRTLADVVTEIEDLASGVGDEEIEHSRCDNLLLETLDALTPVNPRDPLHEPLTRIVTAWRKGSKHWWWA